MSQYPGLGTFPEGIIADILSLILSETVSLLYMGIGVGPIIIVTSQYQVSEVQRQLFVYMLGSDKYKFRDQRQNWMWALGPNGLGYQATRGGREALWANFQWTKVLPCGGSCGKCKMSPSATLEMPLASGQYLYAPCPAMMCCLLDVHFINVFAALDVVRSQITSLRCGNHPWRKLADEKVFNIFFILS